MKPVKFNKYNVKIYPNGNKIFESYLNDSNKYHNELGPAVIWYYENGNKSSEDYYINGKLHNTNGPATIHYYINKNKKGESYFINGNLHNTNDASKIWYCENGEVEFKEYWLNNEFINVYSDEEFKKYIKRLNIS